MLNKIKQNETFYPWLRDVITPIYTSLFMYMFRIFPIKKNKVFIVSYFGKGYGDNGKYIAEELMQKNKNIEIYWGAKKSYKESFPSTIHCTKYYSPKFFYHLATAKVWINNSRFFSGTIKRKKQFYIQLWHGDIGFKKIEADAANSLPKNYIKGAKNDGKMTNLMTSGSRFFTNLCHNSFWYKGEVLECGCPRNDVFFNKKACDDFYHKIRSYYKFKQTDKILLYAPTFRKNHTLKYYDIDFENTLKTLHKKFDDNWKILVRLHPNVAAKSAKMKIWNDHIINATNYPNAQELLIASDVIITDYSSIIFDFALLNRPAFLFAPDYELYDKDRGFYLDYFNLPFSVAENTKQLQKNISNFSEKEYKVRLTKFMKEEVGLKETGEASRIIAKRIIKELNEN